MKKSRIFHAFEQKLAYFDDDIELIDVLVLSIVAGDLNPKEENKVLARVDPNQHTHLKRRRDSDGSRKNIINHLRATLYSSYIKDVYEEVTLYLRCILEKVAIQGLDSKRIIGEHGFKIDAKEVLQSGSWEVVSRLITDSLFQTLEAEKSTLSLLKKIANKLALEIDEDLINGALPYLEVRHFLVHTDGKLSDEFIRKYPQIKKKKGKALLDIAFIKNMQKTVKELVIAYDQQIIEKQLLKDEDLYNNKNT